MYRREETNLYLNWNLFHWKVQKKMEKLNHFCSRKQNIFEKRKGKGKWVGLEKIKWIQKVVVDPSWGRGFCIEVKAYKDKIHFLPWGTYILGLRICLTGRSTWHFIEMLISNLVNGRNNLIIIECDIEAQTLVNTGIKSALVSQQAETLRKESESRLVWRHGRAMLHIYLLDLYCLFFPFSLCKKGEIFKAFLAKSRECSKVLLAVKSHQLNPDPKVLLQVSHAVWDKGVRGAHFLSETLSYANDTASSWDVILCFFWSSKNLEANKLGEVLTWHLDKIKHISSTLRS